jgi:uroporphyrinogen decarboxylase
MTPRDNLLALYRRQPYEQMPPAFLFCPGLEAEYRRRYGDGPSAEERFGCASSHFWLSAPTEGGTRDWSTFYDFELKAGTTYDMWGVAHELGSEAAHHMTRMRHPLATARTVDDIMAYPMPDYGAADVAELRRRVDEAHAKGLAFVGEMACTVWESAWYMRSMEALMADMADESPLATALLDRVTAINTKRALLYVEAGADMLALGDDVGTQRALLMSKRMYQQWIKPRHAAVIAAAKAVKPDLLVQYHSCGHVTPLIDDFIDAGIDILNPVQPECMDVPDVLRRFAGRISFNGTIGTQSTMPHGTPDEVRAMVARNLELAGPNGGLLACPTHMLEPEVPWANIEAYVDACRAWSPVLA